MHQYTTHHYFITISTNDDHQYLKPNFHLLSLLADLLNLLKLQATTSCKTQVCKNPNKPRNNYTTS